MIVAVSFRGTWLTNPLTPDLTVHSPVADRKGAFTQGGDFRAYAGGRIRVITTATRTRTRLVTMQSLTDDDLALVDAWAGQTLLLRDQWGLRQWVSYLAPTWTDVLTGDGVLHDVQLPLTVITYIEGV